MYRRYLTRWGLSLAALCAGALPIQGEEKAAVDFARDVRPLLAEKCVRCHGPKKQESGLRLDLRRAVFEGGDSGPVLKPGEADKSELLHRVTSQEERKRMPPVGKPLTASEVALLRAWIDQGAKWPDELAGSEKTSGHWAFRPVQRPQPPRVKNADWVRNPIDSFILERLERAGIAPAPEADRRTLVRRLHFDLVGLPPMLEDMERALRDESGGWYEAVVDRLLQSPHFGERWGRHWLDLARFAESDGYENDRIRPDAWRYRDWVIDAFNRDLPFDRFTLEQLAGDLLPEAKDEQKLATGFHRNTLYNSAASGDKEEFRTYAIKDRTDTTGTAWMGLTLGCAKCHSHKYDPVSQKEYYQLYAFFNRTDNHEIALAGGKGLTLRTSNRPTHVHLRGNFLQKGEEVAPATPAFLPPLKVRDKAADRLDLANWLIDPAHPLTARVAANRCWQHLFGKGLVPTPDNVGTNGLPPTHPELLDWLASELMGIADSPNHPQAAPNNPQSAIRNPQSKAWSQKHLIRLIVLSAAYRQSARHRAELASVDPNNALVARQNRFRVEAEIVRDLALSVSGLLDPKLGGPSIVPPFPKELPTGQFSAEALKGPTPERHRRSVYIHVQRTLLHPLLSTFDAADPNQPCVRRERSCTPMQALALLNDPTFAECARALSERLRKASADRTERLDFGFRLCLGRPPSDAELAVLVELVVKQEQLGAKEELVWTGVARTLLNLESFTTRE